MQPSSDEKPSFQVPAPGYSLPPQNSFFARWGKLVIGCSVLVLVVLFLLGRGFTRLFSSRRGGIQTLACFQNLRTTQRGLDLYSQDYDQTLPQAAAWMDTLTPYVKNRTEFKCPIVRLANPTGFGYAFNSKLSGAKKALIDAPELTAVVYDSANSARNASDALTSLPSPTRHVLEGRRSTGSVPEHGNLILFADGHMRFVGLDGTSIDITKMDFRRTLFGRPPKAK